MDIIKVAALQITSHADIEENLAKVESWLVKAQEQQIQLVVLPENFASFGCKNPLDIGRSEASDQGPIRQRISHWARQFNLYIQAGTLPVAPSPEASGPVYASSFLYDPQGKELGCYRKLHLFDVDVRDGFGAYRESSQFLPGDKITLIDSPFAQLGLSVCYDLRFPELFRLMALNGAEIFLCPSAFTQVTGAAHWEILVRARAIENLCYMVAANQWGQHDAKRSTFGHSMIVSPWGEVLACLPEGEGLVTAQLELGVLSELRASMPCLQHQRLHIDFT